MVVTESGMAMLANELHPWKAPSLMVVTEPGMAMLANELHPSKALFPIEVTECEMVTVSYTHLTLPTKA